MALLADRVKETTTTTGTGTVSLAGAPAGFQSFNTAFANGSLVYYVIQGGAEWEIGIGTTGTGTLARTQVLQSSNADALVPFSAGVKDVFCSYVADRAVTTVDAATLTNKTIDDYTNNIGANSTHFRIKATGTISKGSVVKATGYNPGEQAIEVAVVTSATDLVLGISEQALTTGQFGMAVVIGELFDVNTNGFTVGNIIYSNGAGGFTETKPASGLYQALGWIVRANTNNGVIAVNVVAPLYVETATNTANTSVLRDGSGNFAAGTITATLSGTATQVSNALTAGTYLTSGGTYNGSTARTFAVDATDANTASKVVARDASGNFAAGTITATLNGAAPAGSLSGTTLAANVVTSSLTSVGTLTSGAIGAGFTAIPDSALATISTAGKVSNSATTATSANTASAIVARDGSGNFSAGTITATLNGAAPAGSLSGSTLASGVTASSLTSVGTLSSLTVSGNATLNSTSGFTLIGTTTVAYSGTKLNIGNTSDSQNGVQIQTSTTGVGYLLFGDGAGADAYRGEISYNHSADSLGFRTATVERMSINSVGNLAVDTDTLFVDAANNRVGVGTASPAVPLHTETTGTSTSAFGNVISTFRSQAAGRDVSLQFSDGSTQSYFGMLSGSLRFAAGTSTTQLMLDTSGNLGLGVTPSAWASAAAGYSVMQIRNAAFYGISTNIARMSANAFVDGSGVNTYISSGFATRHDQVDGEFRWLTAPSGTAGNAITFTQAMTLDASGNLLVGTTTATARVEAVAGTGTVTLARFRTGDSTAANNAGALFYATSSATATNRNAGLVLDADGANGTGGDYFAIQKDGNDGLVSLNQVGNAAMAFYTANIERARLDASGNLGLGVTPSAWYAGAKAFQFGGNAALLNNASNASYFLHNAFYDTAWRYITSGQQAGAYSQINGTHQWSTAPSGTAGNAITFTQALTLDASGNLGLGVTPSAWTNNYKGIELSGAALTSNDTTSTIYIQNAYVSGGQFLYKTSAFASSYTQSAGQHQWRTAPSGTAGNAITFTQAMTLDASGNLGIGTSSPSARLNVVSSPDATYNSQVIIGNTGGVNQKLTFNPTVSSAIGGITDGSLLFYANGANTERARIDANGNLGLGVTPGSWGSTYSAFQFGTTGSLYSAKSGADFVSLDYNVIVTAANDTYRQTDVATRYRQNSGQHRWFTATSGTAGAAITFTERLRVDATTTAGQTALLLWDVDNGTLERVTVGAADSGGTGFKVLRIPN